MEGEMKTIGKDAEGLGYNDGQTRVREDYAAREDVTGYLTPSDGWDDALINALGRGEILESLCAVENTDDNWQTIGMSWCALYNAGAKRGARDAAQAILAASKTAKKYVAVAGQDADTCSALGWSALSIRPYVVASGEDEAAVMETAIARLGHEDVHMHEVK